MGACHPQCARMDLNKKSGPKPKTTAEYIFSGSKSKFPTLGHLLHYEK